MTEFDDMKSKWQALNTSTSTSANDNPLAGLTPARRSQLHKVRRTFMLLTIVSAMCAFCIPATLLDIGMSRWFVVVSCLFFVLCMLGNLWLRFKAEQIDMLSASATGAMEQVQWLMSRRMLMKWILFPLGIFLVASILYFVSNDIYALLGGIAGGLIGFLCGYRIDRTITRQLRDIARELEQIE